MFLLSNNFESFGMDIGDRSLKVAYIKKSRSTPVLASYGSLAITPGLIEQGRNKDEAELIKFFQQAVKGAAGKKISTPFVHACLPETQTFIKLLTVESKTEGELPARIREELPNHFPVSPDELYIDWHLVEKGKNGANRLLVGAVPKTIADGYLKILLAAGLEPVSLQIEAESILRSLLPQADLPKTPIALIDIGASRSSFICFDHGSIQFTVSLDIAGDNITDLIKNQLNLSFEEAEQAKKICGLDHQSGEGIIKEIISHVVDDLANTITRNIAYYAEHFPQSSPITSVILCGGGSKMRNLKEMLSTKLKNIRIYHGNPLINLVKNLKSVVRQPGADGDFNFLRPDVQFEKIKVAAPLSPEVALVYTTAIGLALENIFY
ncbi:MAG: pilus assembly protein PilM [Candidatus Komeilibacteria bacterium]|nr:pilus assembly protein PilM [Candidatus Komeilibacteria bacterium]